MQPNKEHLHKLKTVGIWSIFMVVFITELFFYTWCRVQCIQIGYDISQKADQHRQLMTLQNNLKIELAHLRSPERVARIAKYHLGLSMPTADQMIVIP